MSIRRLVQRAHAVEWSAIIKYKRAQAQNNSANLDSDCKKLAPLATLTEEGHISWHPAFAQLMSLLGLKVQDSAPGVGATKAAPFGRPRKIIFQKATQVLSEEVEPAE